MSSRAATSLRAAGLRATPQRQAIIQALEEADRPLTVEELLARMAGHGSGIPTVYRNLQQFAEQGWAEAIIGSDQVMRFVRCRSTHHHHHLQCERCGRMVEVEGCGLQQALEAMAARTGFRITRHSLQVFGLCPECGVTTD